MSSRHPDGPRNRIGSKHYNLAGVMGWPVAHSRSPKLHGYWIDRYDLSGAYALLPVAPENLAVALKASRRWDSPAAT